MNLRRLMHLFRKARSWRLRWPGSARSFDHLIVAGGSELLTLTLRSGRDRYGRPRSWVILLASWIKPGHCGHRARTVLRLRAERFTQLGPSKWANSSNTSML
jgi:hypothetical protein